MEDDIIETLHIYAQTFWHEDAVIVGTSDALLQLRDTITRVLYDTDVENGEASLEVDASDGEGYNVRVQCRTEAQIDKLRLPYTDADANWKDGEYP